MPPSAVASRARGIVIVVGPRLVVSVRDRVPCRYPARASPTRADRAAPNAASSSSATMRSMVSRTRSRITRSMVSAATSRPSPGSRFLLSLPMASSSGTRCPAGAVVGQLRRMMTPSFHFSTTRPTLPGSEAGHNPSGLARISRDAPLRPSQRAIEPRVALPCTFGRPRPVLRVVLLECLVGDPRLPDEPGHDVLAAALVLGLHERQRDEGVLHRVEAAVADAECREALTPWAGPQARFHGVFAFMAYPTIWVSHAEARHDPLGGTLERRRAVRRNLRLLALRRPGRFRLGFLERHLRPLEQPPRVLPRIRRGPADEVLGLRELRDHARRDGLTAARGDRLSARTGTARARAGQRGRRSG